MAAPWRRQSDRRPSGRQAASPPTRQPLNITRLDAKPAAPPREPERRPPEPAPANLFAARFRDTAAALTLIAAAGDAARHAYPRACRAPDGAVWAVVRPDHRAHAELAWALGGTVFKPDGADLISPGGRRCAWADVVAWPDVSLVELATGVAPGGSAGDQHEAVVVTTGRLARWIIGRFTSGDIEVRFSSARLDGLFRPGQGEWPAVLVHVTGHDRPIPRARLLSLSGLPGTVVCRPGGGRLLVDQRLSLPLSDEELGRSVPPGQEWLLSGDLGAWRISDRSREFPPPLQSHPDLEPPAAREGRLPADLGVTVRLVPDGRPQTIDALLLSDRDLRSLRGFLTGHPAGERAFLVPGPGWHLLADPGHGVSDIPFGVQLHRVGPGALYTEAGYRLRPDVPGPARAGLFEVDERSAVVLRPDGNANCRLSLDAAVPVWSLWLGPVREAETGGGLSAAAVSLLERADAVGAGTHASGSVPATGTPDPRTHGLRAEGFQLEQQGQLVAAARKFWEAGEHVTAGRLYELAAESESGPGGDGAAR